MQLIRNLWAQWNRLRHLGTQPDRSKQDNKHIVATNTSTLLAVVITLPYLPLYVALGVDWPLYSFYTVAAIQACYLATLVLNYHRYYGAAKLLFLAGGGVQLTFIALLVGPQSGLQNYLIAAVIVPYYILGQKYFWSRRLILLSLGAIYFGTLYYHQHYQPLLEMDSELLALFSYINVVLVIAWLSGMGFYFYKTNVEVESALAEERDRSHQLLLNVMPAEVAHELQRLGEYQPRYYEDVTVMFTDFHGFTQAAESLTPQDLVSRLDDCFRRFDEIVANHNLEKLKTIGDGYMCAGGLPNQRAGHATAMVQAALEICRYMENLANQRKRQGLPFWQLRIGIHSGPLVAGIIGQNRFAYDVWGDTVNTASRLESASEVGRVNISRATYEKVGAQFTCTPRGHIQVKGKQPLEMFFVEPKPSRT